MCSIYVTYIDTSSVKNNVDYTAFFSYSCQPITPANYPHTAALVTSNSYSNAGLGRSFASSSTNGEASRFFSLDSREEQTSLCSIRNFLPRSHTGFPPTNTFSSFSVERLTAAGDLTGFGRWVLLSFLPPAPPMLFSLSSGVHFNT